MWEGLECLELTRARLQEHTCAIVGSSGGLKCWGYGADGQVRGRFVGRGRGGRAMWGGWVFDVVVTPCVLRSLETAR